MSDPASRITAIAKQLAHAVDPLTDVIPKVTAQLRGLINAMAAIPNDERKGP